MSRRSSLPASPRAAGTSEGGRANRGRGSAGRSQWESDWRCGPAPCPPAGGAAGAPPSSLSFPLAAMAATEQEQFYALLGNLLSPDNAVRKQAEVTGPPRPRLPRRPVRPAGPRWRAGGRKEGRGAGRRRGRPSPTCEQRHQLPPGRSGPSPVGAAGPGGGGRFAWRAQGPRRPLAREGAKGPVTPLGARPGVSGTALAPRPPRDRLPPWPGRDRPQGLLVPAAHGWLLLSRPA